VVKTTGVLADATVWIRRIGILVGVLIVMAGIGKLAYGPAKTIWGRRHARASEDLWRGGDVNAAAQRLKAALQFAPRDPSVLRWAAQYCSKVGLPQGMMYYEMLLTQPEATRADHVAYAELALRFNRLDFAGRELTQLLAKEPEAQDLLLLLVTQQRLARDIEAAVKTARRVLQLRPADEQAQFVLGSLLLEHRARPELAAEGRRLLMGIVVSRGKLSQDAVMRLASARGLDRADLDILSRYVTDFPPKTVPERLLATDLRLMSHPAQSNQLVVETVRSLLPELKTTNVATLVNWAALRGGAAPLLEALPIRPNETNSATLSLRGVVLGQAGDWNALDKLLEGFEARMEPFIVEKLKGQLALARGRTPDAQTHFQAAIAATLVTPMQLRALARELEGNQLPRLAAQANVRAMNLASRSGDIAQTLNAGLEVLRLLASTDDAETIRDTLRILSKALPGDDALAAERAWYDLLFREEMAAATAVARRLHAARPDDVASRVLLALAEFRADRLPEAVQILEEPPIDWSKARPRWKAIYVAALGASQRREAARRFASQIPAGSLKPLEQQLVEPWR
jgi:tetratricopeptide (TPR) repeat protein